MMNNSLWYIFLYLFITICRSRYPPSAVHNKCHKYWSEKYLDVCPKLKLQNKYCIPFSSSNCRYGNRKCHLTYNLYLQITLKTFGEQFATTNNYKLIQKILEIIWYYIGGKDINKLALFVSSAVHNTSYFKVFRDNCETDIYRSRGLLMIQGRENYEWLSCHSLKRNTDYINNPELLSIPNYRAIGDTIAFWEYKLKGCYTFVNMMESLKICSWLENKHNQDIVNWNNSYIQLRGAYNGNY